MHGSSWICEVVSWTKALADGEAEDQKEDEVLGPQKEASTMISRTPNRLSHFSCISIQTAAVLCLPNLPLKLLKAKTQHHGNTQHHNQTWHLKEPGAFS